MTIIIDLKGHLFLTDDSEIMWDEYSATCEKNLEITGELSRIAGKLSRTAG
jgi:hypothetical protein